MNVAESMPPVTAVPMAFMAPAPAPVATASGNVPKKKANDVMITGRNRILTAARVASTSPSPCRICSLMNWMMRIAFFVESPSVVRKPIWK